MGRLSRDGGSARGEGALPCCRETRPDLVHHSSPSTIGSQRDLKVIIMGDFNVGKTSLVCRYIEGKFKDQEPTIGAAFFLKQWGPYNVAVWDTAGDEKYAGLSQFYCRSAGAAILAYDMTEPKTFESLWARFTPMLSAANDDCLRIVVGTKMDLLPAGKREIEVVEGQNLARELNSHIDLSKAPREPYFETSSKNNNGVEQVFEYIFQHCLPLSEEQKKKHSQHKDVVDLNDKGGIHGNSRGSCKC